MPDSKISNLTAASTLDGTETLPVVQGGTTKKATVTQVLAGQSYQRSFSFAAWTPPKAALTNNTWLYQFNSAYPQGHRTINLNHAQGDAIGWDVVLESGTWDFALVHPKDNDIAIFTVKIDGTSIGTIDGYNATTTNARSTLTGITVATSGLHTLQLVIASKNASSSDFYAPFTALGFTRTGA